MASTAIADRMRVAGLLLGRIVLAGRAGLRRPSRFLAGLAASTPERLLIAPQDIRTAGSDHRGGYLFRLFCFRRQDVNAHGRSPFELEPRSQAGRRARGFFAGSVILRAADTALARANARALVAMVFCAAGRPSDNPAGSPRSRRGACLSCCRNRH